MIRKVASWSVFVCMGILLLVSCGGVKDKVNVNSEKNSSNLSELNENIDPTQVQETRLVCGCECKTAIDLNNNGRADDYLSSRTDRVDYDFAISPADPCPPEVTRCLGYKIINGSEPTTLSGVLEVCLKK